MMLNVVDGRLTPYLDSLQGKVNSLRELKSANGTSTSMLSRGVQYRKGDTLKISFGR